MILSCFENFFWYTIMLNRIISGILVPNNLPLPLAPPPLELPQYVKKKKINNLAFLKIKVTSLCEKLRLKCSLK